MKLKKSHRRAAPRSRRLAQPLKHGYEVQMLCDHHGGAHIVNRWTCAQCWARWYEATRAQRVQPPQRYQTTSNRGT